MTSHPGAWGLSRACTFQRRAALLVWVRLGDGKDKCLTGTVVYCRCVREGWYLTGVRFGTVQDGRLNPNLCTRKPAPPAKPKAAEKKTPAAESEERPTASRRDRALSVLAAAGATRLMTRETIAKVVTLTASSDHAVRRATIPVLMQMPRQESVLAIIQLLSDANAGVLGDAIDALGKLKATQAIGPLRELLGHKNSEIAVRAAEALGYLEDDGGLQVAIRHLLSDTPLNRRAARAVGAIFGQPFRPTSDGVASARRYLKAKKIIK